jgi:hypothetical protein
MDNSFATMAGTDLNTSAKEGPVHFGAKPKLGWTAFTSFFSEEEEEPLPLLPLPIGPERKSTTFLSSSENLIQPHPALPSGITMNHFRPPNLKEETSKKRPSLFPPLRAIRSFDPSLNDFTISCSSGKPNNISNIDASHLQLWEFIMTTPRKFFLFSSTLSADAPTKVEKAKDFDSTKNFLSISQHPRSTNDQAKPKITSPEKEPPKPKSTLTDSPARITPQQTSKTETRNTWEYNFLLSF